MNYVEKLLDGVQSVMKLNPSTFSGAVDIVCVQQEDGTLRSTPWHVRFGKIHLLNPSEQKVHVYVNGRRIKGIKMKLGSAGEAYFLHEEGEATAAHVTTASSKSDAIPSVGPLSTTSLLSPASASPDVSDTEIESLRSSAELPAGAVDSTTGSIHMIPQKDSRDESGIISSGPSDASAAGALSAKPRRPSASLSPASSSSPVGSPPVAGSQVLDGQSNPPGSQDPSQQQSGSRWSWGWGTLPKRSKDAPVSESTKIPNQATLSDDSDHSHSPSPADRHIHHRPRSSSFDGNPGSLRAVRSDDSLMTTQASTSAESANTTPIAQDPNTNPSGSWSSSVGSWFALFKKPKKSGSEPVVHVEQKAMAPSSGDVDEYDRRLEIHDFSRGSTVDQDDDDDDAQYLDADDQLNDAPLASGPITAVPVPPTRAEDVPSSSSRDPQFEFSDSMSDTSNPPSHVVDMGNYNNGHDDGTIFEMDEQVDAPKYAKYAPLLADALESHNAIPTFRIRSSSSANSILVGGTKTPPRSPEKARRIALSGSGSTESAVEPVLPQLAALREFNLEVSKCGNIIFNPDYVGDDVKTAEAFKQNIVTYEALSSDPNLIFHPDMVFRVENKLYPWQVAAPFLVSLFAFQRKLDAQVMEQHYTKWKEANKKSSGSVWTRWLPRGWRRQETSTSATSTPLKDGPVKSGSSNSVLSSGAARSLSASLNAAAAAAPAQVSSSDKMLDNDDDDEESESATDANGNKIVYVRALKPLPEQLAALNLQPGKNRIQFKVKSSKTKGSFAEVTSNIFLWEASVKIVVSDIDGTITKTDVFGQIFPVFGKDWSHIGVAELFSNIKANGYEILYLTARSIGAASITKEYLASLKQESGHSLPDGPVFMSPDRLLNALNREVILRKPEQFKISCLSDIKNLFPAGSYPFYAGFGNRHTDAISYVAVSIPKAKIFIINPQGEIECASKSVRRSYTKINELVEQMFPPYHLKVPAKAQTEEEWNDFNYWRNASTLTMSIDDIEAALKPSK